MISKKRESQLLLLGFIKKYVQEEKYCWYEYKFKHFLHHKPKIVIEDNNISLVVTDNTSNMEYDVFKTKYSMKWLVKLLRYSKNNVK